MAHFAHPAVLQEHFHNVEADLYLWVLQQAQVIQRGPREPPSPLLIHRCGWPRPFLGGASLDLDEHEAVVIAEDKVYLAAWRAEIGGEELQALAFELLFGGPLAQFAVAEVERLFRPAQPGFDARRKVHAMPEKDFFDCGSASFYNCRVLKTTQIAP